MPQQHQVHRFPENSRNTPEPSGEKLQPSSKTNTTCHLMQTQSPAFTNQNEFRIEIIRLPPPLAPHSSGRNFKYCQRYKSEGAHEIIQPKEQEELRAAERSESRVRAARTERQYFQRLLHRLREGRGVKSAGQSEKFRSRARESHVCNKSRAAPAAADLYYS